MYLAIATGIAAWTGMVALMLRFLTTARQFDLASEAANRRWIAQYRANRRAAF